MMLATECRTVVAFATPDAAWAGVEALCDYFRWRAVHDCRRNSISMLAQAHFPHERLHGVSARACLAMLEAKGVRWECDTPEHFRL